MNHSDSSDDSIDAGTEFGVSQIHENYIRLQQENLSLKKANSNLQEQFDSLSQVSNQMVAVHQQNNELTKQIRSLKAEVDDSNRRLQISLDKNKELEQMLEKEKENRTRNWQSGSNDLKTAIQKEQNEKQILKLEFARLREKYEAQIRTLQDENNHTNQLMEQILEASQNYFHKQFSSQQEYLIYLSNSAISEASEREKTYTTSLKAQEDATKQIKSSYKAEKKQRKQLEQELENLREQLRKEKLNNEQLSNQNAIRIAEIKQANDLQAINYKEEKETLKAQLKAAQGLIEKLKIQQTPSSAATERQASLEAEIISLKQQLKASCEKQISQSSVISNLQRQNADLSNHISAFTNSRETLQKNYSQLKIENDNLKQKFEQLRKENEALKIDKIDLEEQVTSAVSQVQAAKATFKQSQAAFAEEDGKLEKLTLGLGILEKLTESQKNEITSLYNDRVRAINIISKQNQIIKAADSLITTYKKEAKELKTQLNNERAKTANAVIQQPDEIPVTSWFCSEFPRELNNSLSEIATNVALQASAKLKNVLITIARYYNAASEKAAKSYDSTRKELEQHIDLLGQYTESTSVALRVKKITADDLIANASLISTVTALIKDMIDQLDRKTEALDGSYEHIKTMFGLLQANEFEDAERNIVDLRNAVKTLNSIQKSLKHKLSKEQTARKTLETKQQNDKVENERLQKQLKAQIEQLSSEKDSTFAKLIAAQSDVMKLRGEVSRLKHTAETEKAGQELELDRIVGEYKDQWGEEKRQLNEMISAKDGMIATLSNEIETLELEKHQLESTNKQLMNECAEKGKRIADMSLENETYRNELEDNNSREKTELTAKFQKNIDTMKAKNNEQRLMIDKLTTSLNESEERNKCLYSLNTQLSNAVKQQEEAISNLNDDLTRERKLVETKMKSVQLTTEMKCQALLDDEKTAAEQERRKIFGFIASEFRQFFDARKPLEDESFKAIVTSTHKELDRLTRMEDSLRRLLGLDDSESPEDAVSKLLLNMFMTK